ncbi:MAG: hypothetical protein CL797_10545 [Chromatiales bacterium]|nr:hypothetical protein [Chromatiales bacterium]
MSSELFYKIIDDLKVIPETHNFYITLSRINEPLMDRRLKEFSLHIQKVFPTTKQIIWSNGTLLTKRNIEWISKIDSASFSISLNSLDDDEHKIFMGLPLPPVVRKLDYLHDLLSKNLINNDVVLYAPYLTQKQAEKFQKSCAQRYPLFKSVNRPVFTWAGGSKKGSVEILQSDPNMQNASWKKNLPCGQWFDLHILANGYVTKCCIDEAGFSDKAYNTVDNNCLDLYARTLPYRQHLPSRITVQGCEECIHLD